MKIQNKIALIFTLVTGGIILSLSAFIYFFASDNISRNFFHRLEVRSRLMGSASLSNNHSATALFYDVKENHLDNLTGENHHLIRNSVYDSADTALQRLQLPESFLKKVAEGETSYYQRNDSAFVGIRLENKTGAITVISSAVDVYGQQEIESLRKLLTIGFLIAMVFVFTFGEVFSTQIFSPIRRIIANVKGISAHNLHQRLEIEGHKDEIEDLSKTFNALLNRLEITFEMQNNFVSNASHEFKTPLTVISGEAQLGLSIPALPEPVYDAFRVVFREAEKLEHLTNSMLSLAQTGFDGKKAQREPVRIDELLLNTRETIGQLIPENKVVINFDTLPEDDLKLTVWGNYTLLKSAFTNIIANSCKYSDNKEVLLTINTDHKKVTVEIRDKGIGIPPKEISQIFVPFFRASNTSRYKGYGIGLPLTFNILKMHEGTILVTSEENVGTNCIVQLPHMA